MHVDSKSRINRHARAVSRAIVIPDEVRRESIRRQRLILLAAGAASAALLGFATFSRGQTIAVMQVEAGISAVQPAYSPVEFVSGGSVNSTTTDPRYGSISFTNTYSALSTTSVTFSGHAQAVGDAYYKAGTIGATAINKVFVSPAVIYNTNGAVGSTPFFTNNLGVINAANAFVGAAPAGVNSAVKVINNSYVYQYPDETVNIQAARRVDFMINRDNVTWVAGAVTGTQFVGGSGATTLGWRPRNGIAVSSSASQTPFDPTLNSALSQYAGRAHADIWDANGLASFASSEVAGFAAALIQRGNQLGNSSAVDNRVVKSLIMSGAEKIADVAQGFNYVPTTSNNLDPLWGAGKANYNNSLAVLNAGQRSYASVTASGGSTNVATGTVPTIGGQGWGLGTIAADSTNVILVHFTGPVTGLGSSLNWNWTSAQSGPNIDTSDTGLIATDLNYQLQAVTWNGTNYVLAPRPSNVTGRALFSDAAGVDSDNSENLFISNIATAALAPGTYALVMRNKDTSLAVTAAVSYNATVGGLPTWNLNADGMWSTAGSNNWTGGFTPNGISQTAVLGSASVGGPRTITLGNSVTVGTLSFTGTADYTVNPTSTQGITLNNAGLGAASIAVAGGTQNLNIKLVNTQTTTVSVSGSASLTVGGISNSGTFAITGAGAFAVSGTVIPPFAASGGTIAVGPGAKAQFTNPGAATFTRVIDQSSISLAGTSTTTNKATLELTGNATLPRGANKANVARVNSISIAGSSPNYFGFLDLKASDVVVTGGVSSLATLRSYVAAWYNGGSVTSLGVGSTLAGGAASPYTIAVFPNVDSNGNAFFNSYDGVTVTAADVILKFTYKGDTNLDGVLNGADVSNLIEGLSTGKTGWQWGDIDYNGAVDGADFALLNTYLSNQPAGSLGNGAGGAGGNGGSVPEPTSLALIAPALLTLTRRRRA